jgi:hypothetical protein
VVVIGFVEGPDCKNFLGIWNSLRMGIKCPQL